MRHNQNARASYLTYKFNLMWYIIGFISAIDVYYAIKWRETLPELEENPIGRMLINYDANDISFFMGLKVAGTVLVLGILQNAFLLGKKETKLTVQKITFGVFVFQLWLFLYMHDYFLGGR